MATRWDAGHWTAGPVSLFSAAGITAKPAWPKLVPQLAAQQAAQGAVLQSSGSAGTSAGGPAPGTPAGSTTLKGALSYAQLEQLWVQAGGNPAVRNVAAAIAMAESGGRQDAWNVNKNGSVDRGYWQINSSHGSQSTFDALGNARAAVAISANGTNWGPWVTFGSGAYKKFLQPLSSQPPVPATPAPAPSSGKPVLL